MCDINTNIVNYTNFLFLLNLKNFSCIQSITNKLSHVLILTLEVLDTSSNSIALIGTKDEDVDAQMHMQNSPKSTNRILISKIELHTVKCEMAVDIDCDNQSCTRAN